MTLMYNIAFILAFLVTCGTSIITILVVGIIWKRLEVKQRKRNQNNTKKVIGFFHPYCNAGGGGERVLWCAIRAIQLKYPDIECIVYTGDCDAKPEDILNHAKLKFNISLPKTVNFYFLKKREWVEARHYPYFTLLGQGIGSMVLAYEALQTYVPDIFFDSMGYSMTYFIFKTLAKCDIGCYVHYPTISTDMLGVVSDRTGSFNNRAVIAKSALLTNLKLLYYHIFAWIYGCAGNKSDVIMVNSTWTKGHIESLWRSSDSIYKVFPPCDVQTFLEIPLSRPQNEPDVKQILSISQFRPEKNQKLQVKSFAHFLAKKSESERMKYRLILAGGCRNDGDKSRIDELKSLSKQLGVANNIDIKINISFDELKQLLISSHVGMHTMNNEHFGIGIVEFQAAGVIPLAHNSGGPKMDIVIDIDEQSTGYLAKTVAEYSEALEKIFAMSPEERLRMTEAARKACERFSEARFEEDYLVAMKKII